MILAISSRCPIPSLLQSTCTVKMLKSELAVPWPAHSSFAQPFAFNNASTDQLALLGWPEQRLTNLMRERRRSGFKDLADLQERLCLPATSVEAMIGRVSFGSRRAGPSLPLP